MMKLLICLNKPCESDLLQIVKHFVILVLDLPRSYDILLESPPTYENMYPKWPAAW